MAHHDRNMDLRTFVRENHQEMRRLYERTIGNNDAISFQSSMKRLVGYLSKLRSLVPNMDEEEAHAFLNSRNRLYRDINLYSMTRRPMKGVNFLPRWVAVADDGGCRGRRRTQTRVYATKPSKYSAPTCGSVPFDRKSEGCPICFGFGTHCN